MRTILITLTSIFCVVASNAQNWNVSIPNRAIYSVATDPDDPSLVYAGNVARTFLKSTDGGVTWDERLIGDGGGGSLIVLFKVHPRDNNVLFAGGTGFDGLDRSEDNGETWTNVLKSTDGSRFELESSGSLVFHPTHPDTAYAVRFNNGVVYRTGNSGKDWDSIGVPPSLQGTDRMRALTICPDSTNVMLMGGRLAYVYRSSDRGVTWAIAPGYVAPQPDMDIANFAWSPSTPGTVYATAQYSLRQNTTNGGLIRSTDYGLNWTRLRCTDTSLYALHIRSTPQGDEIFLGGNQIDFPPDPGYIKGDSIVVRYKVADSSLRDLSSVVWTENEIGEVGTNVWGFAVAKRSGIETLLMASNGGLFSSDILTSLEEQVLVHSRGKMFATTSAHSLTLHFENLEGELMYRLLSMDGRTLVSGVANTSNSQIVIPFTWNTPAVYIAEVFASNEVQKTLFVR